MHCDITGQSNSQKTPCNLLCFCRCMHMRESEDSLQFIVCVSAGRFTRVPLCICRSQKTTCNLLCFCRWIYTCATVLYTRESEDTCGSQLSPSTTQGWNSAVRLGVQCLYPLNSLAGSSLVYACMIHPPCIFLNIICILKFMPYYMTVLPVCMVPAEIKRECRGPWNWS